MAYNPNAIFVSPSSLSDFEKCPQLYYYRNVYRSPRGLKIQLINPALALGQAVHETLDVFLKYLPSQRSKDLLLEKFEFIWANFSGEKGGFFSENQETDYKNRAIEMLERFWQNEHFKNTQTEKLPDFLKVDLGEDIFLTGKLDWLEKEGDLYHLVDFKTGKEEREDSLQLSIYSVLVSHLFKTRNIKASYWYLDKDTDIVPFTLLDMDEVVSYLKNKGEIIKMVRQTKSYRCQSGGESCWACRDMVAIAQGKGKLVSVDYVSRKQETYILPPESFKVEEEKLPPPNDDLPF